jgi:hypothetical protein
MRFHDTIFEIGLTQDRGHLQICVALVAVAHELFLSKCINACYWKRHQESARRGILTRTILTLPYCAASRGRDGFTRAEVALRSNATITRPDTAFVRNTGLHLTSSASGSDAIQ